MKTIWSLIILSLALMGSGYYIYDHDKKLIFKYENDKEALSMLKWLASQPYTTPEQAAIELQLEKKCRTRMAEIQDSLIFMRVKP